MPLDTGGVTSLDLRNSGDRETNRASGLTPSLEVGPDIGAALKAARELRGLNLQELADSTRIRRSYLAAIEEMRLEELPSRPFTIGYIRAYAAALGLDGDAAVERFRRDEPVTDTALRAPIGVVESKDPRLTLVIGGGMLVIAAIVLWNVAQRAMTAEAPPPHTAPAAAIAKAKLGAPAGPVALGAPLPAPVESTTPTPYETPGLAEATAAGGSSDAVVAAKKAAALTPQADPTAAEPLPPTFVPRGAVYGAQPAASIVTLQARKGASLIVRGSGGAAYFARQLSAGEAYRVPNLKGLTLEVTDPAAFQVFVGGQSKGVMPAPTIAAEKLVG
ncbi:cytoskeletal protein RodZ [Phenylobacterium haematophilum]|jgi:cytoskeletal protein RodZ|uniref:Cytoskeletal protein RodZ n=1 Tax=Phenylobacterium haematophilum TaxID=98513 RepID=A0A840A086_9CAUL|nr:helix-turn-helix transcriptional regulator [Phenylobacterium haematophilum]MBB3891808.1 cytoskeletal protein RodZ [Phenylobacterium haematophilum]